MCQIKTLYTWNLNNLYVNYISYWKNVSYKSSEGIVFWAVNRCKCAKMVNQESVLFSYYGKFTIRWAFSFGGRKVMKSEDCSILKGWHVMEENERKTEKKFPSFLPSFSLLFPWDNGIMICSLENTLISLTFCSSPIKTKIKSPFLPTKAMFCLLVLWLGLSKEFLFKWCFSSIHHFNICMPVSLFP